MRKKDILISVIIILITLSIAFYPTISEMLKNDNISNTTGSTLSNPSTATQIDSSLKITITIEGEINAPSISGDSKEVCNKVAIEYLKGVTYGEIIHSIRNFLTGYSIIEDDFSRVYDKDATIIIASCYISENIEEGDYVYIKINTASYSELITLYGIGDKRANKIIEYRKNKNIESFDELKKLLGVSDNVIEAIKKKAIL